MYPIEYFLNDMDCDNHFDKNELNNAFESAKNDIISSNKLQSEKNQLIQKIDTEQQKATDHYFKNDPNSKQPSELTPCNMAFNKCVT